MTNWKAKALVALRRSGVYIVWVAIFATCQALAHLIPHACTF